MTELFAQLNMGTGSVTILLVGLVFKLTGFAVRDEMLLRVLVVCGFICDAAYYYFRADPIIPSVLSNLALLSINVILISAIALERTRWRMSAEDRETFALFPTLTPGQFRRLKKIITAEAAPAGAVLTREGAPVDDLMLVFAPTITITKAGESFPINGPAFVGEIAFLTGNTSSADVTLPEGGTVLRVDSAALRQRMARSPAFNNAMIALFGAELARKVANSVPMDRAPSASG
ncbi:cyclic nucleotide-binding domain-containing protein [Gymnodinialimonas ceratoperidinii]|uniref:Cyclic nucleotide-binding domain-containing protein n=1 Tax=Gymnodinialimonas ceratoperidinii TaxID=2856823 RepID=A0A8F6YC51_9RHOB|nr:cyclic nucleotide-binding domain-containing protein [Gymnodinialimonas ceratoperidinii]QXT38857.1 cyclic nucleotide-binding domain-containing protein [Gymnodinialimonas ceratoperidinii]